MELVGIDPIALVGNDFFAEKALPEPFRSDTATFKKIM